MTQTWRSSAIGSSWRTRGALIQPMPSIQPGSLPSPSSRLDRHVHQELDRPAQPAVGELLGLSGEARRSNGTGRGSTGHRQVEAKSAEVRRRRSRVPGCPLSARRGVELRPPGGDRHRWAGHGHHRLVVAQRHHLDVALRGGLRRSCGRRVGIEAQEARASTSLRSFQAGRVQARWAIAASIAPATAGSAVGGLLSDDPGLRHREPPLLQEPRRTAGADAPARRPPPPRRSRRGR